MYEMIRTAVGDNFLFRDLPPDAFEGLVDRLTRLPTEEKQIICREGEKGTHYSLLTTYCLLLTTYYLLLTSHCLLLTTYYLLRTTYY